MNAGQRPPEVRPAGRAQLEQYAACRGLLPRPAARRPPIGRRPRPPLAAGAGGRRGTRGGAGGQPSYGLDTGQVLVLP